MVKIKRKIKYTDQVSIADGLILSLMHPNLFESLFFWTGSKHTRSMYTPSPTKKYIWKSNISKNDIKIEK